MALQNFDFPGVELRQVFNESPAQGTSTLGVLCIGQQYKLHSAADAGDASLIEDAYNVGGMAVSNLPNKTIGGVVDTSANAPLRLIVQDGAFSYEAAPVAVTAGDASNVVTIADKTLDTATGGVAFTNGTLLKGDPVVVTLGDGSKINTTVAMLVAGTGSVIVYLAAEVATAVSITPCKYASATFTRGNGVDFSSTGVAVAANLKTEINTGSKVVEGALQYGKLYLEYREKLFDYVNAIGSVTSPAEVAGILGEATPENPLAVAVYFAAAASGGNAVYFNCVSEGSTEAYLNALDYADPYSNIYSVCIDNEDQDKILALTQACISKSGDTDSKIRRVMWFGVTSSKEAVLVQTATVSGFTAGDSTSTVVLDDSAVLGMNIKAGDVVRTAAGDYPIIDTNYNDTLTVEGVTPITTGTAVSIVRTSPAAADIIKGTIAKRYVSTYRAQAVWADGVLFNGYSLGNYALAAAAAGMRAAEEVQRPLSNLSYNFFSLQESLGLTRTQLKELGANGLWLIANNADGTPINMKQITTAMANDLNQDEESIISNADEVALSLCRIGEDLVGCSNITPILISTLSNTITLVMDEKLNNGTRATVGNQLLSWRLVDIYQDAVNRDHVYAVIECEPPKPFNKFIMTLVII